MTPHYIDDAVTLYHGDCIEVMASLPDASVDAVVTDPPYGLEFMGKEWDRPWAVTAEASVGYEGRDDLRLPSHRDGRNANCRACGGRARGSRRCTCDTPDWDRHPRQDMVDFGEWCQLWATEALRVLKPGGHLLAFGGTRTWHRLAVAVEDAGFEVRDSLAWLYASGFPKSLDVSKAIDKAAGAERERQEPQSRKQASAAIHPTGFGADGWSPQVNIPATPDAARWQGWGTALKPAFEPIVVARKPLIGTVAANVLEHGTGALNVDGCRIEGEPDRASGWSKSGSKGGPNDAMSGPNYDREPKPDNPAGRWPANVILDEAQAAELDRQSGVLVSGKMMPTHTTATRSVYGQNANGGYVTSETYGDTGGASRFFYVPKADSNERPRVDGVAHPTVKPLALMQWLVRLVTPPGGVVLEPFAGSGTTAEACVIENFRCIAIEREADYLPLIVSRLSKPIEVTLL